MLAFSPVHRPPTYAHLCSVKRLILNHVAIVFYQLKQSASDKLVLCENVKIDWGLNEVRFSREISKSRFNALRNEMFSWLCNGFARALCLCQKIATLRLFPCGRQRSLDH